MVERGLTLACEPLLGDVNKPPKSTTKQLFVERCFCSGRNVEAQFSGLALFFGLWELKSTAM